MIGLLTLVQAVAFVVVSTSSKLRDDSSSQALLLFRRAKSDDSGEEPVIPVSLSVCLSPGCKADGAEAALEKLKALAPEHIHVEGGPCRSFCGSGPVVVSDSPTGVGGKMKTVPHKRISSEERILGLLYADGAVPADLVKGYNLGVVGDKALAEKRYEEAVKLYEDAVGFGFRPAIELQEKRDKFEHKQELSNEGTGSKGNTRWQRTTPVALEWLVRIRRNEALAKMELGDLDGAVLAAHASCNISKNTSHESIIVLARIHEKGQDVDGELQALENLFELPVDENSLSVKEKNDRRLAGLRLQKLQFQRQKAAK